MTSDLSTMLCVVDWLTLAASVLGGTLGGNVLTQLAVQKYAANQKETERQSIRIDAHRTELREAYAHLVAAVDELIEMGSEFITSYRRLIRAKRQLTAYKRVVDELARAAMELERARVQQDAVMSDVRTTQPDPVTLQTTPERLRERATTLLGHADQLDENMTLDRLALDNDQNTARADRLAARWPSVSDQVRVKGVVVQLLENDSARRFALDTLVAAFKVPAVDAFDRLPTEGDEAASFLDNVIKGQLERQRIRDAMMSLLAGMDAPPPLR